ncbi:MAG: colanic acid biosynthesis glycosyltransferase WcaL, partial [Alphaproteobacteria bacterium]|nr:colanic acid biosynthesis glycosyltransferase WcaL [Alphaproteobacteria bacterium]
MTQKPKIAYLTGEYPRASDTFIQREVFALRALGHEVLTCSVRATGAAHHVGPEQQAEAAATFKVLQ